ncbi:PREDICTED: protein JTB [Thamnophis sirtalis]|uniref:Protein JTB n=1 Tax=Thamnophis sirtalis TaxID=35019 RepID=A0A6I9YQE0_9SAUR|nr:PREDICTED: protein JTB [Thamnophis sirtalis]XP_032090087.1 protein JTB [Thamnophis elegans]
MGPRWRLALGALLGLVVAPSRSAEGLAENDAKAPASLTGTTPCWRREDFVVTTECSPCTSFQIKTMSECGVTGFVEQINCGVSKKGEFKSCRSLEMETRAFWRFEGAMLGAAGVFALLVVFRQRVLDGKALEKVRKQIESI